MKRRGTRRYGWLIPQAGALLWLASAGAAHAQAPAPASAQVDVPPVGTTAAAPADAEFDQTVARAQQAMQSERYTDALSAWNSAYKLRQRSSLLIEIARAHRRLGNAQDAASAYRRYLAAEPNPPATARAEAELALSQIEKLLPPAAPVAGAAGYPPGPSVPPLPPGMVYGQLERDGFIGIVPMRLEKRPDSRLLKAGWSLMGLGYGAAFIAGMTYGVITSIDSSSSSSRSLSNDAGFKASAWTLLIPIIGPFVSGIIAPATTDPYSRGNAALTWTLPWMLVDGVAQVAGLGLTLAGHKYKRLVPVLVPQSGAGGSVSLRPFATPETAGLFASGTF